jgi:hypothetical protein
MSEWIKVSDKLPSDNEEYLVFNKWGIIDISHFLPSLNDFASDSITYWMRLPLPPEDK